MTRELVLADRGLPAHPAEIDAVDDPDRASTWLAAVGLVPTQLVAIHSDSGRVDGVWHDGSLQTGVTGWLRQLNRDHERGRFNCYLSANRPRVGCGRKPTKADIEAIRCVFADVDAKGRSLAEAYEAIAAVPLAPSFIIASGGGFQPFWMLHEALPATPGNVQRVEALGRRIAEIVGGDRVQNADRILRIPFLTNWPDARKRSVGRVPVAAGVVSGSSGARYTLDEIEAAVPPPSAGELPPRPTSAVVPLFSRQPSRSIAAAKSGLLNNWFDALPPEKKNELIEAVAGAPAGRALADQPRAEWLNYLWGFADAGARGATRAREVALAWCQTSTKFTGEADFDTAWRSFKQKVGGTTVGALIAAAAKSGIDLSRWRDAAAAASGTPSASETAPSTTGVTRGAPISLMPHTTMSEAQAQAETDARLCMIGNWGDGTPGPGRFHNDGTISRLKTAEVATLLAGYGVDVEGGKGGTKFVSAATWWSNSPRKLLFDRVVYDPEGVDSAPGEKTLNRWSGFAVQPAKGNWRRIRRHLWKVLCGRNRIAFKYFVRWLAHAVQHPGTNPEVMVVIRSDLEGVGKSSLGHWMLRCFGRHALEVANYAQVFGNFNAGIAEKSFVLLEEPFFPGDHQAAAVLRAMLTARTITLNPKGRAAYEVPHRLHFLMTTNAAWAIPAGPEARRFLVLDARQKMDRAYFDALWAEAEAENGGIAAMLHDLLRVDLRRFNVRDVPATTALVEQQRRSADDVARWIADSVVDGQLVPGEPQGGGFGTTLPTAKLRGAYLMWCMTNGVRRPQSAVEFGRALAAMGLTRTRSNNPRMWVIPNARTLLSASDRRAGIRRPS